MVLPPYDELVSMATAELASFGSTTVSCVLEGASPPCFPGGLGIGVASEVISQHGARRIFAFESFLVWFERKAINAERGCPAHLSVFRELVVLRLNSLVMEYGVRSRLGVVREVVARACDE